MPPKRKYATLNELYAERDKRQRIQYKKSKVAKGKEPIQGISALALTTVSVPLEITEKLRYNIDKGEGQKSLQNPEFMVCDTFSLAKNYPNKNNIASSSNNSAPGEHRHSKKAEQKSMVDKKSSDILEQIATEPVVLSEVPNCIYCGAKGFEYEPPGFCGSLGEIHLLPTKMRRELMLFYLGDSEGANKFQKCIGVK
ncbi:hypothetical protein ACH5RR_008969 [Cinchona calisaya]|uniref:Uncharacterized protein n=1 Tax=Cinchona calisaya TaxID=153742 RepID=A0ABD3AD35_9GENT